MRTSLSYAHPAPTAIYASGIDVCSRLADSAAKYARSFSPDAHNVCLADNLPYAANGGEAPVSRE